jgi:AraC family transcriptional regulator
MFAVEEGSFGYRVGDVEGTAVFGDAVLCPPGTVFEREVIEPVSFHFITLAWQAGSLQGSLTTAPPLPIEPAAEPAPSVHLTFRDHNRLSSTYFYMSQLARLPDGLRLLFWNHYLHDLWQQYSLEKSLAQVAYDQQEERERDPVMLEAAGWLQQHAFGQVALKQLSAGYGLSPVQFTRKFQAAYGMTPIDYLTSLRIQKAQTLLLETEMTLEQIADRCGYENGFYLSRVFSKKMKLSPSQYRKAHRV